MAESDASAFGIGSASRNSALPKPVDSEIAVKARNCYADERDQWPSGECRFTLADATRTTDRNDSAGRKIRHRCASAKVRHTVQVYHYERVSDMELNTRHEKFLQLSAYLTGMERIELLGTGLLEKYYKFFVENVIEAMGQDDDLAWWDLNSVAIEELQDTGEFLANEPWAPIAKNIVRMWYLGTWRKKADDPFSAVVISAQSYQEGLVWKLMSTHPPGAKQPGYGTWSELPLQRKPKLEINNGKE